MNIGLDELNTVQDYIQTLFDSLPAVALDEYSDSLQQNLIEQSILYGRKIIELSDKFTAKYRNDHLFDRKDIEEKVALIHRIVCQQHYSGAGIQEMIAQILRTLNEEKVSYIDVQSRGSYVTQSRPGSINPLHNAGVKQSKLQYYRDDADLVELRYEHNTSQPKRASKMGKSKNSEQNQQGLASKRKNSVSGSQVKAHKPPKKTHDDFTTKNVLELKNQFQHETQAIKSLFDKINRMAKSSTLKLSEQNCIFTKEVSDQNANNLKDFAMANIQNNFKNIQKISNLLELLEEHYEKKVSVEGFAQTKFKIYTEEINKREEVYSFAVSKLLENLADLRDNVTRNQSSAASLNLLDALQSLGNQFYKLYPSHDIIKDLKVQPSEREQFKMGIKDYGCQVSIGKTDKTVHREMQSSKRNLLQLYKVTTRVNEHIERFQKSIKFKKQLEQKQVQKFVQCIRGSFPRKNPTQIPTSVVSEITSYQEELKKVMDQNERNEKQLSDDFSKKNKKNQKKIAELEKVIDELVCQLKKQEENKEGDKKKLMRKLQTQREENKNLLGVKKELERHIKELGKQVNRLQDDMRDNHRKFDNVEQNLIKQNRDLQNQAQKNIQQVKKLEDKLQEETRKWNEEREIYHQKIIILETNEQHTAEEISQLKIQLQEMIKQNTDVKKQIIQLTEGYEQNVKQQEQLIHTIKQLEIKVKDKKNQIKQLKEKLRLQEQNNKILQTQAKGYIQSIRRLQKLCDERQEQTIKFKQLGFLNDSDINTLKQEMDKVKEAYLSSQEQLENIRSYAADLQNERDYLLRENRKISKDIEEVNARWQNNSMNKQRMQKDIREAKDQLEHKNRESTYFKQQAEDTKRQLTKLKKQSQEIQQKYAECESQLRRLRQDLQRKSENESLQTGKRKLELEATKVELRRKTQQLEKMKESFDEKIQMLESKNRELSQFITQKQLLARINNGHVSQ